MPPDLKIVGELLQHAVSVIAKRPVSARWGNLNPRTGVGPVEQPQTVLAALVLPGARAVVAHRSVAIRPRLLEAIVELLEDRHTRDVL